MNPDFRDMLSILSEEGVEFLVLGAHALAAHGYVRATGDLDILGALLAGQRREVWRSLKRFGAPLLDLTLEDLNTPGLGFQIGVAPNRIDLLTSVAGVEFDEAWPSRKTTEIEGKPVAVIGRAELLRNKKAAGRPKDLADAAWLESEP